MRHGSRKVSLKSSKKVQFNDCEGPTEGLKAHYEYNQTINKKPSRPDKQININKQPVNKKTS